MSIRVARGQASIQVDQGRLRIRFPRQLFQGKLKILSLGLPATREGWLEAERKLRAIQSDIDLGTFDPSLKKYESQAKSSDYLQSVSILYPEISLLELWLKHLEYKKPTLKESTINYLENSVTRYLKKIEVSPYQALELRQRLLEITTKSMAKRVLTYCKSAFDWGIKHKLVRGVNPFDGMSAEFKHYYQLESKPNAFSLEEKQKVLVAFSEDKYQNHYFNFVKFLFETGCRPSEAIGLRWRDIAKDFSKITFRENIYRLSNGKAVRQKGSKNNKNRDFPCNENLKLFLQALQSKEHDKEDLIFLSPQQEIINYNNFSKIWHKVVNPIKSETTPYSCRDTFITDQISKGVNLAMIANWVDNSVSTIEKFYFDYSIIKDIIPL
jgi:integrase